MIPSSLADSSSSSSFIIHRSSFINHQSPWKIHQLVDLYLRFAHMWVIFKGSLGHNSMVHWCSIPVEQGDAGSNIFDISGRLLDLPHTVPQHKCSYEFVTQIIKISKHFIIQNITKQELLYMYIYIYIYLSPVCVFYKCIALKSCALAGNKTVLSHGPMG